MVFRLIFNDKSLLWEQIYGNYANEPVTPLKYQIEIKSEPSTTALVENPY